MKIQRKMIALLVTLAVVLVGATPVFAGTQGAPQKLQDICLTVGEGLKAEELGLTNGTPPTLAQEGDILQLRGGDALALYPGATRLSILQGGQETAYCHVLVQAVQLPVLEMQPGQMRLLSLSDTLMQMAGGRTSGFTLTERGSNLLTVKGRSVKANRAGNALLDVLYNGKQVATALVRIHAEDEKSQPIEEAGSAALAFGEQTAWEGNATLAAQDETVLLVRDSSYTGVGVGKTTLYAIEDGSITAQRQVEVTQATLEGVEVALGGATDVTALLTGLPPAIDRADMVLDSGAEPCAAADGLLVAGALPGTGQLSLLYRGWPSKEVSVTVSPVEMPGITLPVGISTTIDPTTVPGNAGLTGQLSLREEKQPGEQPLLTISGLGISANRPGKGTLLVYSGKELAATLPVEVMPTAMQGIMVELGTSLTLQKDELPGYAAGNTPALEEEGAGLLFIKGLKLTGEKPGTTQLRVLYGGEEAALLDVEVTPPVFRDLTLAVGETYELAGIPKSAVLVEAAGGQLLDIQGHKLTAVTPGESRVDVRYGDVFAGSFSVRVTAAPPDEAES